MHSMRQPTGSSTRGAAGAGANMRCPKSSSRDTTRDIVIAVSPTPSAAWLEGGRLDRRPADSVPVAEGASRSCRAGMIALARRHLLPSAQGRSRDPRGADDRSGAGGELHVGGGYASGGGERQGHRLPGVAQWRRRSGWQGGVPRRAWRVEAQIKALTSVTACRRACMPLPHPQRPARVPAADQLDGGAVAADLSWRVHYDPGGTGKHMGPMGTGHLGDLPSYQHPNDCQYGGQLRAHRPALRRGSTACRPFHQPGSQRTVVIHAGGDNYSDTPPLGGGGARIACGVID